MPHVTVTIPSTTEEIFAGSSFLVYCIRVQNDDNNDFWEIKRRYSEFFDLHDHLRRKYENEKLIQTFAFPVKTILQPSKERVEDRRRAFEKYLSDLVTLKPIPSDVKIFLRLANLKLSENGTSESSGKRLNPTTESATPNQAIATTPTSTSTKSAVVPNLVTKFLCRKDVGVAVTSADDMDDETNGVGRSRMPQIFGRGLTTTVLLCIVFSTSYIIRVALFPMVCTCVLLFRRKQNLGPLLVELQKAIRAAAAATFHVAVIRTGLLITMGVILALFLWFLAMAHRVIGYCAATYLSNLLGTPKGAFQFEIGWIALRLGLDESEIVLSDFMWRNPPRFDEGEKEADKKQFLTVKRLMIRFHLMTVYEAIMESKPIKIYLIEIDKLEMQMKKKRCVVSEEELLLHPERSKKDELNLWAALGADKVEDEKKVEGSVMASLSAAVGAGAKVGGDLLDAVVKYNPASVLYRFATAHAEDNSDSHDQAQHPSSPSGKKFASLGAGAGVEGGDGGDEETTRARLVGRSASSADAPPSTNRVIKRSASFNEHKRNAAPPSSPMTASAKRRGVQGVPPGREAEKDDGDGDGDTGRDSMVGGERGHRESLSGDADVAAEAGGPRAHWGVPYLFDVDECRIRDLSLFAQDFLNKEHSTEAKSDWRAIKMASVIMERKELMEKAKKGGNRQPVYLDDLTWRIVARLIAELFATNKLAMANILASAAANQTTAAVLGTVSSVTKGMQEKIYTYNPKTLAAGAASVGTSAINLVASAVISSAKIERSAVVKNRNIAHLTVRLLSARNIVAHGKHVNTISCKFKLINQNDVGGDRDQHKSSAAKADDDGLVVWGHEVFELGPIAHLKAELHIRIFESRMFGKDVMLFESSLPLDRGSGIEDTLEGLGGGAVECGGGGEGGGRAAVEAAGASSKAAKTIGLREEVVAWHKFGDTSLGSSNGGELLLGLTLG